MLYTVYQLFSIFVCAMKITNDSNNIITFIILHVMQFKTMNPNFALQVLRAATAVLHSAFVTIK